MTKQWQQLLICTLLLIVFGITTMAQTATLNGIVTDQNAAVVPGVLLKLTNTLTGESLVATTSESGNYTIPLVKPGIYELTAEARAASSTLPTISRAIRWLRCCWVT